MGFDIRSLTATDTEYHSPRPEHAFTKVPATGIAAAIGLTLYFAGAVLTVLRARSYKTVAFPLLYLAPVVTTLALTATS